MKRPSRMGIDTKHLDAFQGWIEFIQQMAAREGKIISEGRAYRYLLECIQTNLQSFSDSAQWPDLLGYDYVDY